MRLIVGLGNPGKRYADTWHNLGARVALELVKRWRVSFKKGRGECQIAESGADRPALMIPTSYMNRSGEPVAGWANYHKVSPEEMLIVLDDHDLPLGKLRLRPYGSSGGHNGLSDIIEKLDSKQIPRLRIGIRTGREADGLADQVLSPIPSRLREDVNIVIQTAADAVEMAVRDGVSAAMNRYNRWNLYPDIMNDEL